MFRRSNGTGGSGSPTSAESTTLIQEYDAIQKANIFPHVQEDNSVGTAPSGGLGSSIRGGGASTCSALLLDNDSEHSEGQSLSNWSLQVQVESLRQQLAERDAMVNDLQRQIQEDKRARDKLQARWDLFFGTSTTASSSSSASRHSYDPMGGSHAGHGHSSRSFRRLSLNNTSSHSHASSSDVSSQGNGGANSQNNNPSSAMDKAQLIRLNNYIEKLEAEKEASLQKTVRLSVQLAESKARESTLESTLDEYKSIILYQNGSTISRFGRNKQVPTPVSIASIRASSSPSSYTDTTASSPSPSSSRQAPASSFAPQSSPVPPPLESFPPVTDIELNDDDDDDNNNANFNDNSDELGTSNANSFDSIKKSIPTLLPSMMVGPDPDSDHSNSNGSDLDDFGASLSTCNMEDSSLGWSNRPLTYLSERGSHSERSGTSSVSNGARYERGTRSPSNNTSSNNSVSSNRFTGALRGIGEFLKVS